MGRVCLAEDSELAIRFHAAGDVSVLLTHPYGRGLISSFFVESTLITAA